MYLMFTLDGYLSSQDLPMLLHRCGNEMLRTEGVLRCHDTGGVGEGRGLFSAKAAATTRL